MISTCDSYFIVVVTTGISILVMIMLVYCYYYFMIWISVVLFEALWQGIDRPV